MNIIIKFDFDEHGVYIPDGYIQNIEEFQRDFILWMEDQKQCIVCNNERLNYSFNVETVLDYINNVILSDSRERAYIIQLERNRKKRVRTISF